MSHVGLDEAIEKETGVSYESRFGGQCPGKGQFHP